MTSRSKAAEDDSELAAATTILDALLHTPDDVDDMDELQIPRLRESLSSPALSFEDLRRMERGEKEFRPLSLEHEHSSDFEASEQEENFHSPFQRIFISEYSQHNPETDHVCRRIRDAISMRQEFAWTKSVLHPAESPEDMYKLDVADMQLPPKSNHSFCMQDGVVTAWEGGQDEQDTSDVVFRAKDVDYFFKSLHRLLLLVGDGPTKTLCYRRLKILATRFELHYFLNQNNETKECKRVPHRDFYNCRKVDNHVHHSACMNQKHLLRFIKSKLKKEPDVVCVHRDGNDMTLKQVFESLNLRAYDISIDTLDMHAHQDTMHRFDKFNLKYNPVGESRLREIFLKTNNHLKGRFLAEVTQEVFDDLEAQKYQFSEYRLSIYGRNANEWDNLASWVCDNDLRSPNVTWLIQIPRLYSVYKRNGLVNSFQDMIDNIFMPLFEVSVDPSSHPKLHAFLRHVVGFDSVDDESVREWGIMRKRKFPSPSEWTGSQNPPYSVWAYYLYANLFVLNKLRESKGLTTFDYRPHAGEAGDIDHLAVTFLTAQGINHGLLLKQSPVLQYLYYLTQVPISMSPLSNNLLFVEYDKNPFPLYHQRGLNVTLSSDDPLLIHYTKDPLLEEYSVAAQVWKLSAIDMCEIALRSVLQSGFDHRLKCKWLGDKYHLSTPDANDIHKTNVPSIRMQFRFELLQEEKRFVLGLPSPIPTEPPSPRSMATTTTARRVSLTTLLPGQEALQKGTGSACE